MQWFPFFKIVVSVTIIQQICGLQPMKKKIEIFCVHKKNIVYREHFDFVMFYT